MRTPGEHSSAASADLGSPWFQRPALLIAVAVGAVAFGPELLTSIPGRLSGFLYAPASYGRAACILLGACALAVPGYALLMRTRGLWLRENIACFSHAVVLGQTAGVLWLYLRSAFNQSVLHVPITRWEILLLIALTGWASLRGGSIYRTASQTWRETGIFAVGLALIVIAMCQHELPRVLMLSTDPDEHAFFVQQFIEQQTLPYSLGVWGPETFEYPGGSAALGYLWHLLTGLGPRSLITILPPLQGALALLMMTESAYGLVGRDRPKARSVKRLAVSGVLLICFYHHVFPYGLDAGHFHQEGTARLATITLFALALSAAFGYLPPHRPRPSSRPILFVIAFAAISVGGFLNPINVVNLGLLFGLALLAVNRQRWATGIFLVIALAILSALALGLDPYYLEMLVGGEVTHVGTAAVHPLAAPREVLTGAVNNLLQALADLRWIHAPVAELGGINGLWVLIPLGLGAIWLLKTKKSLGLPLACLLAAAALLMHPITALTRELSNATSLRLLYGYYNYSTGQIAYLVMLLCLAAVLLAFPLRRWWMAAVFLGAMIGLHQVQAGQKVIRFSPRVRMCGSRGCFNESDAKILRKLEGLYAHYVNNGGSTHPDDIPKILLPNEIMAVGDEQWLFPRGGTRALPFVDTFPAAFFYFHGQPYYSYADYQQHVCEHLDISWLLKRNIRYLYKASDDTHTCVSLPHSLNPVAKEGNAALFDLAHP